MKEIVLTTLNSTYQHTAFGLRYIFANLGELQNKTELVEFTINRNDKEISEQILKLRPKIVGFGVYIWNVEETLKVVQCLKKVSPEIIVILGGPEVSHETESQAICSWADFVIQGEADFLFGETCGKILSGELQAGVSKKIISGPLPEIHQLKLPYEYYTPNDIENRIVYVEASRGCPYKCEYCLSSLDKSVRAFETENFISEMQMLLDRGVRQFKFIDRTFNLSPITCEKILTFFLGKIDLGLFLHFEMVPDKLPESIKQLLPRFPAGSLQFEIGIQTWNPEVAANVSRRNNLEKVVENLTFLAEKTHVHSHVDLIAGLPGEDVDSFGAGFDRLVALKPSEVQVGILKRLNGAPIKRHHQKFEMMYEEVSPYQILKTQHMSFAEIQLISRFAKYWDSIGNSGNFLKFIDHFQTLEGSFFWNFIELSENLSQRFEGRNHIALTSLFEGIYQFGKEKDWDLEALRPILAEDFLRSAKSQLPGYLKSQNEEVIPQSSVTKNSLKKRQEKHSAAHASQN